MSVETIAAEGRVVSAVFGAAEIVSDPDWEWEYAAHLKATHGQAELAGDLLAVPQ